MEPGTRGVGQGAVIWAQEGRLVGGEMGSGHVDGRAGEVGMGGARVLGGRCMPLWERNGHGDMWRMGTSGEGGRGVSARGG